MLQTEWCLIQCNKDKKFPSSSDAHERIDSFWSRIFSLHTMSEVKYPYTTKVIKAILSLVHGSAGVERGFSESGNLLTSNRSNMDERTFNAQCAILDGLKMYDNKSYKVPITSELLRFAQNAHRSYQIYLEDPEREEKEMEKQKEKDEKMLAKEREIAENWKKRGNNY